MDIIEQQMGDVVVLQLDGRLDGAACEALTARTVHSLEGGARALLLDLARLAYLTSEGFRTLLRARTIATDSKSKLALCGLNGFALELFAISGLQDYFTTYPTRQDALAALGTKGAD
jgi:anti-sigma B factor antagonist